MKSTLARVNNLTNADTRTLVTDLVMSAPAEYEPGEAEAIIDKAIERFNHIEANGLKVCRHESGGLLGFVLVTLDANLFDITHKIYEFTGEKDAKVYVDARFYGMEEAPKVINHGFTENDLGHVFFVVEANDTSCMPGHNSCIPGSICSDMDWGEERDDQFRAFATKFASVVEIRPVNYLSHGLILIHDLNRVSHKNRHYYPEWVKRFPLTKLRRFSLGAPDAFGKEFIIDYIQQPYSTDDEANLYMWPHGHISGYSPDWSTGYVGNRSVCAAVCIAR